MTDRTARIINQSGGHYTAADAAWLDALSGDQVQRLMQHYMPGSCDICGGNGWKRIAEARGDRVVRCDCFVRKHNLSRIGSAMVPPKYEHCTLETFRAYAYGQKAALEMAQEIVDHYPWAPRTYTNPEIPEASTSSYRAGLCLLGPTGVGKTHLAVGVLRALHARHRIYGVFYSTTELLRLIRAAYDPMLGACDQRALTRAMEADLLVLDDLGAERATDWVLDTLQMVIDTRYTHCRRTIVTSNHVDAPAESGDPDSLEARIGFRIRSRLAEMCEFVDLGGCDHRTLPPGATADEIAKRSHERRGQRGSNAGLPSRAGRSARAQLRSGTADLKWAGSRGGNVK